MSVEKRIRYTFIGLLVLAVVLRAPNKTGVDGVS